MTKAAAFLLAVLLTGCAGIAPAQTAKYPERAVTLVVPFSAGGSSDMISRPLAELLGESLGEPVAVVNKPGASGAVGAAYVAQSAADGYTLLNASNSPVTVAPFTSDLSYSFDDFTPVGRSVIMPTCLTVRADSPFDTLESLLSHLREDPESVTVGTPGAGSTHHLTLEHFSSLAGVRFTHMPFEGANGAIVALLGGHIDSTLTGVPEVISQYQSGEFRILCVFTPERLALLPEVPTAEELGFDVGDRCAWYGLMVSSGTDEKIVRTLEEALRRAVEDPGFAETAKKLNMIPAFLPGEEFAELIQTECEVNEKILAQIGMEK